MERDFLNSAKAVLNLVKADLALGRSPVESLRMALVEASKSGQRRVLKSEGLL